MRTVSGKKWGLAIIMALAMAAGCNQGGGNGKDVVVIGKPVDVDDLAGQNLTEFHLNSGKQNVSLCIACHGDKSTGTATYDLNVADPHNIHAEETALTCIDCHKSVDLMQKSGAQLRHQVATEICARCHSGSGPGAQLFLTGP